MLLWVGSIAIALLPLIVAIRVSTSQELHVLSTILNTDSKDIKYDMLIYGGENRTNLFSYLNEDASNPVISALDAVNDMRAFENIHVLVCYLHSGNIDQSTKILTQWTAFRKSHSTISSVIYLLQNHNVSKVVKELKQIVQYKTYFIVASGTKFQVKTIFPGLQSNEKTTGKTCTNPLVGKTVNVSVFGTVPYVDKAKWPLEGSDIDVIKILAQKIGFKLNLRLAKSWNKAAVAVRARHVQFQNSYSYHFFMFFPNPIRLSMAHVKLALEILTAVPAEI